MKLKKELLLSLIFASSLFLSACKDTKEVNIYNTTDLHSHFTKELKNEINKIDRKNSLLLDAGDSIDIQTEDDSQWNTGERSIGYLHTQTDTKGYEEVNGHIIEKIKKPMEGLPPIYENFLKAKYDALILGNHEFYMPPENLKELVSNCKKNNLNILSGNTFLNKEYIASKEDKNISKPYIIKNIQAENKNIKIAIFGITTTTVNFEEPFKNGKEIISDKVYIQNDPSYKGKFYMTDMVNESKKIVKEIKEKENPDMIILVTHSGEKPKIPRHSGNRVQELAKQVPDLDLIIAGHTHVFIDQHNYTGPNGKKVVVTQSGCHSKGLGKSTAKFEFKNNKWTIKNINSTNIRLKADKNDPEDDSFEPTEKNKEESGFRLVSEEDFKNLTKENKNIFLNFFVMSDKKLDFPKNPAVSLDHEYYDKKSKHYIYYFTTRDLELAKKYTKLATKN